MASYPAINGYHYSWSSIEITVAGEVTTLLKEISYTYARERGVGRGVSGQKRLRTRGDDEPEASLTFYKKDWDAFVERLGDGWADVEFDISVHYADEGMPSVTDEILRCVISSVETGGSEGTDPTEVAVELDVMDVKLNGKKARA